MHQDESSLTNQVTTIHDEGSNLILRHAPLSLFFKKKEARKLKK